MTRLYLHIGTHKTGSTSLQRWLRDHQPVLDRNGFAMYQGMYRDVNHTELYMASMRYDREAFKKRRMKDTVFDQAYTETVAERVGAFLDRCDREKVVFTCEGLSLLRHPDEIDRLRDILQADKYEIRIVVYLRDKSEFLKSYRAQLQKDPSRKPATEFWSAMYVEDDTWLTDYESLVDLYKNAFGHDRVQAIDYDVEMKSRANVIPSFIEFLGLNLDEGEVSSELQTYRDNATLSAKPPRGRRRGLWRRMPWALRAV